MFIIILWLSSNFTNKFFIFEYLLNFTRKCIGGQVKAFSFLFCAACDPKSTKYGKRCVNIHSDSETTCKKRTDSSTVFTCNGKVLIGRER